MKTILLIEDNQNIRENLIEYLQMEGYKVIVSNNGKDGFELAKDQIPDLIICDVLMQDMDGFEVLRLLLEEPITHHIPFMFSTSMSEKIDMEDALKLGADDYIIKPFELDELLQKSKKLIESGSKRNLMAPAYSDFSLRNASIFNNAPGVRQ